MAKLHRFVKLYDRFDSQIFTFELPAKVVTDTISGTWSKDIVYGYHKWTVSFIRNDLHLGCFLKWLSNCSGMKCQLDFSFTLLNREHFTRNETFIEKGFVFTSELNQHGRQTFVALHDLWERDFSQVTGDYLIELEMRKVNCVFESYIRLPREIQSRFAYETKLESAYFSFGLFDWSISLIPSEGNMLQDESITLQLHRHTSFDHLCNVRYYISLGENGGFQSEELDQLVDIAGYGELYIIGGSVQKLAKGRTSLKVKVAMVSVVSVSEITLNVASKSKNKANLYDKDKQAWLVEADMTGSHLAFRLYYTDITNVPQKYSRFVCWNMLVLTRYIPDHKVQTNYGPFSKYYVQQDLDDGHLITTTIPVADLTDASCLYTEPDDPHLTLHIEWVESHLLATPTYHAHDDIDKLQKHQMRREILALQSENLVLEKQLHSYQQSMAKSMDKDGTLSQPAYKADIKTDITSSQSHMSPVNSTVTDNQSYISARKSSLTNNQSNTSPVKSTVTDSQSYISTRKSSLTNNKSNMASTNSVVTDSQSNISARKSSLTINQSDIAAINASVTDSKSNITRKSSLANNQSNMGVIKSTVTYSQSNNPVIRSSVVNNPSNMEIRSSVTNGQSNLSAKRSSVPNRESNILDLSTSSERKNRPQERYETVTINKAQVSSQQVNTSADRINKTVERFVTPATETETLPMNKCNSPNDPLHKTNVSSTRFEYIQSAGSGNSERQIKMTPIYKCNITEENVNTTTYTATEIYGSPIDRLKMNASNYKTPMHKSQAQLDERPSATKNRRNSGTTKYDLDREKIGTNKDRDLEEPKRNVTKDPTPERVRPDDISRPVPRERKETRGSKRGLETGLEERRKGSRDRGYEKDSSGDRMSYR